MNKVRNDVCDSVADIYHSVNDLLAMKNIATKVGEILGKINKLSDLLELFD